MCFRFEMKRCRVLPRKVGFQMAEIIPISPDLCVECSSSLSPEECKELETFLEAQPEVKAVLRRIKTRDSRDILGLLTPQHFDLAVELTKQVVQTVLVTALAELVRRWISSPRESRKEKADENTELVAICGPDGNTVKIVKKPKP